MTEMMMKSGVPRHFLQFYRAVCSNTLFSNTSALTNSLLFRSNSTCKFLEHLVLSNTSGFQFCGPLARTNFLSALCGLPNKRPRKSRVQEVIRVRKPLSGGAPWTPKHLFYCVSLQSGRGGPISADFLNPWLSGLLSFAEGGGSSPQKLPLEDLAFWAPNCQFSFWISVALGQFQGPLDIQNSPPSNFRRFDPPIPVSNLFPSFQT